MLLQSLRLLQLIIFVQCSKRGLASALVAGSEVDEEWTRVERRFGVLKRKLSDYA